MHCVSLWAGCKPPNVNVDFVPREIKVKAGKNIEIEIPYTGQLSCIPVLKLILFTLQRLFRFLLWNIKMLIAH